MGTKNNPGKFDCYGKAKPYESMFVLLGRDRHGPILVRLWAILRWLTGERSEKVSEAWACAASMKQYRRWRSS